MRLPLPSTKKENTRKGGDTNVQGEIQTSMDVIANDIFLNHLRPVVRRMASEEEEGVIIGDGEDYQVAFDPLDGSSNLDVNVATGSIFSVMSVNDNHDDDDEGSFTGRSGRKSIVAAGYALYSSSVEFILSLSSQQDPNSDSPPVAVGFTLDPDIIHHDASFRFILSRPNLSCPTRGPYYSLNEARSPDWPNGLKRWVEDAKAGRTPSKTKYSSRYICSLCADVHRSILKGGWAGNPRPHLRLLYEAAPLAHVLESCGGMASDGKELLLDLVLGEEEKGGLHGRVPVFLGSKDDVADLVSYGDVQQGSVSYDA